MSKRKKFVNEFKLLIKSIEKSQVNHKNEVFEKHFFLSENNRSTRVFKQIETGRITEIVCVSLDVLLNNEWETIVYYDNVHGILHRHERLSIIDRSDSIATISIRQKGTVRRLLKWAIKDITKNYDIYKKRFLRRSGFPKDEILYNIY